MKFRFLSAVALIVFASCQPGDQIEEVVYTNDFSGGDLTGITGGELFEFNSDRVLGPYNNGGFRLHLTQLPKHDLLEVTFTILMHDSWDGNTGGDDGPDRWFFELDGSQVMDVTFSNNPCVAIYCLFQSYPDRFPDYNDPRTGVSYTLPGRCHWADQTDGTSVYVVTKVIAHNNNDAELWFHDKLWQPNTGTPACDESWSFSAIEVKTISY